jgi:hypothetical protein
MFPLCHRPPSCARTHILDAHLQFQGTSQQPLPLHLVKRRNFRILQKIFAFPKKSSARRFFHFFCRIRKFLRLTDTVNTDFKVLIDFLDRFGPEVSGHEMAQPPSEAVAILQRFAMGKCDERERAEVCEMLRLNPVWLRWLADRVKAMRAASVPMR